MGEWGSEGVGELRASVRDKIRHRATPRGMRGKADISRSAAFSAFKGSSAGQAKIARAPLYGLCNDAILPSCVCVFQHHIRLDLYTPSWRSLADARTLSKTFYQKITHVTNWF